MHRVAQISQSRVEYRWPFDIYYEEYRGAAMASMLHVANAYLRVISRRPTPYSSIDVFADMAKNQSGNMASILIYDLITLASASI